MLTDIAHHSEKFHYFYRIAKLQSLHAAARELKIAVPSLSHAVKTLETAAGAPLFFRSHSGVTLTKAGRHLFDFCTRYFRDLEEVQDLLTSPDRASIRRLRVGTFQSIALYFWPLLHSSFHSDETLSLSITTDRSKAILELLVRKEIDVALTVGALTSEGLIHHELYNDSYSFYVSNLNKERYFSRATIAKLAVLFIPDASDENGRSLRDYLHLWDLKFHEKFNLDSFEVVGEFTKRNYGIGILPNQVAKRYKKTIRPVKIEGAGPKCFGTHRFFLSYRDDLELPNSLIKHLLETAHQAVRRLDQA